MGKDNAKKYGRLNSSEGAVLGQHKTYKDYSRKGHIYHRLNLYHFSFGINN